MNNTFTALIAVLKDSQGKTSSKRLLAIITGLAFVLMASYEWLQDAGGLSSPATGMGVVSLSFGLLIAIEGGINLSQKAGVDYVQKLEVTTANMSEVMAKVTQILADNTLTRESLGKEIQEAMRKGLKG